MDSRWSGDRVIDLAAAIDRNAYNVRRGELHYGETEPRDAATCRCDRPGLYLDHDDGELRCWKCGARSAAAVCRS